MKLTVLQENLKNAVNLTSHFITPKAQLPILGNILLKTDKSKLILSSTNLENSISTSIGAKIEEEGEITIPGKTFNDLVGNLSSGQIQIETDKDQINISSGSFKSKIMGINSSDFPSIPNELGKVIVKLPKKILLEALSKTNFAVSNDETRPVLTGILFKFVDDTLHMVATDGFRLSRKIVKLGEKANDRKIIIPKGILLELSKLSSDDDISFSFNEKDNQIVFGVGETIFSSRIIEGEFPDYEKIIPLSKTHSVNVDKFDLEKSVKLASVFARDSGNILKLTVKENTLKVTAESSSSGNQEMEIEAKVETEEKKELEILFNYKFIEDVIRSLDSDDVVIELNGPNAAGKFLDTKDKDFLHLIMPIKVQS